MLARVRLQEKNRPLRIDAGGEQVFAIRIVIFEQRVTRRRQRQGMQVDDAEDVVILLLLQHPVANGAEIVADMAVARWLDAGKTRLRVL